MGDLVCSGSTVDVRVTASFSFASAILLTSLAFLKPHCCPDVNSPGRSTATKLALTLLTGLLFPELTEPLGDRPRLGGDVDWSAPLFSNIARRFRTPPLPVFADMTVRKVSVGVRGIN